MTDIYLSTQQKKLLAVGMNNGRIDWRDITRFYSSKSYAVNAIRRLVELGFFKVVASTGFALSYGFIEEKRSEAIELLRVNG